LPLAQVRRYEAILRRDSSAAPGQATRYELRLTRVLTAASERAATCSVEAVLWVRGGPRLAAGRRIAVEASLVPPPAGRWPTLSSTAAAEAITIEGYRSALFAFRAGLLDAARQRMGALGPATAATLEALVLGSREEIATDLYDGFRASGSLHLLALSGLHAGILFVLARAALRFLRPPGVRNLAAAVVLLGYLFLAGFRPSLFRAVIMILTAAIARLLDRDARPVNLLALAAIALVLVEPAAVLSFSFQLSFLAVAGILVLSPGLQRWLEGGLPRAVAAAVAYSVAAQAATAPLLLARFGVLHPVGIIAALPLIPLVTVFIWAGLAYLLVAGSALGPSATLGLGALHRWLQACVTLFARVPPLFGASAVALTGVLLGTTLAFRLLRAPALEIQ
jgi:ComEC/Rec2-related protein